MPRYPVLDNLKHGGQRHKPGAVVEMDEATAAPLQRGAVPVLGPALPDEADDTAPEVEKTNGNPPPETTGPAQPAGGATQPKKARAK